VQVNDPAWLASGGLRPRWQPTMILARLRRTRTGRRTSPQCVHGLPGCGGAEALIEHLAQRVDSHALGKAGPITIHPQFTRYQLHSETRIPRREHRFARTIVEGLPPVPRKLWRDR
jgi:hypothetical protein